MRIHQHNRHARRFERVHFFISGRKRHNDDAINAIRSRHFSKVFVALLYGFNIHHNHVIAAVAEDTVDATQALYKRGAREKGTMTAMVNVLPSESRRAVGLGT